MTILKERTKLMILLIKWLCILVLKVIIFIQAIMSIKFKRKFNKTERRISKDSEDKPNNNNQDQEKMLKLLNKQWETNLIIKEDKFKLYILISKKEALPLIHLLLIILEDKSLNGIFGIHILMLSKSKRNKTKNKKTVKIKKNKNTIVHKTNQKEDIQLHLRDAWKLWKEWSDKTNKIKNIMNINIIGKKENNKEDLKENYYPFGDLTTKRKKSMLLQSAGIQNIKIYLLFPWAVMISPNKKPVKF